VLLLAFRLLSPRQAFAAVRQGTSVYLFLAGMLLLAELARRQGLFDYLASHAVTAAKGSRARLFLLVYGVGIVVTAVLSNDATAVVLTPAVYAAVKKTGAPVLPYLLICAFIANAASFVLPISNPANLVIFGKHMLPLLDWMKTFALPSIVAIIVTYLVLRALHRKPLRGSVNTNQISTPLSHSGRVVGFGVLASAVVLLAASAFNRDLGMATFLVAALVFALVLLFDRAAFLPVIKAASWSILPLVAGLFVIVKALDATGAVLEARHALHDLNSLPPLAGALAASFGVAVVSNIANNLPVALLAGSAVQDHVPLLLRHALVVGVDLGPNFSITGSLATILWLIAIRREGETVGFWQFLRLGALVTAPALLLATAALLVT
jgi:arsenical pump membrane protein